MDAITQTFKARFPEQDTSHAIHLLSKVAGFKRKNREPWETYLERAKKLHRHLTSAEHRRLLTWNIFANIINRESGAHNKERVEDRLIAQRKFTTDTFGNLIPNEDCTFRDVYSTIVSITKIDPHTERQSLSLHPINQEKVGLDTKHVEILAQGLNTGLTAFGKEVGEALQQSVSTYNQPAQQSFDRGRGGASYNRRDNRREYSNPSQYSNRNRGYNRRPT